jgi:hypothetical protein
VQPRRVVLGVVEDLAWTAIVDALAAVLSPGRVLTEQRRRYTRDAPATDAARSEAVARQKRAQERRQRAEGLYLSGVRDRAWFDVEDAHAAAELAEVERELARIPAAPDETAVRAVWAMLEQVRDALSTIAPEDRAIVLHRLGVVVVGDGGVSLRFRPEIADFLPSARLTFR